MSLRSSAVAAHRSPDTREVRRPYETALEDQYEAALIDLINLKRAGKPITPKERPAAGNVGDLTEALRRSVGGGAQSKASSPRNRARHRLVRRKC